MGAGDRTGGTAHEIASGEKWPPVSSSSVFVKMTRGAVLLSRLGLFFSITSPLWCGIIYLSKGLRWNGFVWGQMCDKIAIVAPRLVCILASN